MENLVLSQYTQQGEELLNQVKQAFQHLGMDTAGLPEHFTSKDDAIKLVFVGQYSAGKSSIIKMLTGEDVAIGAKITTQESKPYPWRGLEIIDTPGIQTGLREDHDKITYNEINHAALLIYVVTNEGFDNTLGKNFRKLAIEEKRAKNMVLVVNKMDRTALGNVPEQQDVIAEDFEKVTTPYRPKDLYISFLDTNSYFESLTEDDPEFKDALMEQSGREIFIKNLNEFVQTHGVLAKVERPLYTIESILKQAIAEQHSIGGSMSLDGAEEVLHRQVNTITQGKSRVQRLVDGAIQKYTNQISAAGWDVSNMINSQCSKESLEAALKDKERVVADLAQQCEHEVSEIINSAVNSMQIEVQKQIESSFTKDVQMQWQREGLIPASHENSETENDSTGSVMKGAAKALGKLSNKSGGTLSATEFMGANMTEFSGTFMHGAIKSVGKFLGFKFAPWQAVQFTKILSGLGTVLGVLGAIYTVWSVITSGDKRKEQEEAIRNAKQQVRGEFDRVADSLRIQVADAVNQYIKSSFDTELESRQAKINEIQQKRLEAAKNSRDFEALLSKTQKLLQDIQAHA